MSHHTLWIVIAVVVALLLIAGVIVASSATRSRRHRQAEQIREQARLESAKLERREALAQETAAKARAAQAEAEVKAAEAARLQEHAAAHQTEATASREQLQEQWDRADRIDPKTGKPGKPDRPDADDAQAAEEDRALVGRVGTSDDGRGRGPARKLSGDPRLTPHLAALQPGVLGRGGEERFQVVAPLGRGGLIGLDTGVLAAIEQQRARLDLRRLRKGLHRTENYEVIAAVVHTGHRTVNVGERTINDR